MFVVFIFSLVVECCHLTEKRPKNLLRGYDIKLVVAGGGVLQGMIAAVTTN
jgi:hypothetical protein